jgi:hypothetical protein
LADFVFKSTSIKTPDIKTSKIKPHVKCGVSCDQLDCTIVPFGITPGCDNNVFSIKYAGA